MVSIATRMLVRNIPLLNPDLLELEKANIAKTQNDKFTTLAAIYDFNKFIFDALYNVNKEYLKFRPPADNVENVYAAFQNAWLKLIKKSDELSKINDGLIMPGEYRKANEKEYDVDEGHILLRPIGIQIYGQLIAQTLGASLKTKKDPSELISNVITDEAINAVMRLPVTLGEAPWKGTIYRNKKIERGAKPLAIKIAAYMLGSESIDRVELLSEYRAHLDDDKASLPLVIK